MNRVYEERDMACKTCFSSSSDFLDVRAWDLRSDDDHVKLIHKALKSVYIY